MWDIVEDIYRSWKVMPTHETLTTDPMIRIEEQDWFEIIQNQLTMYL